MVSGVPNPNRGLDMKRSIWIAAAAAAATMAVPAASSASDDDIRQAGECTAASSSKIKVKPDDGGLEVEFEVDQNRNGRPVEGEDSRTAPTSSSATPPRPTPRAAPSRSSAGSATIPVATRSSASVATRRAASAASPGSPSKHRPSRLPTSDGSAGTLLSTANRRCGSGCDVIRLRLGALLRAIRERPSSRSAHSCSSGWRRVTAAGVGIQRKRSPWNPGWLSQRAPNSMTSTCQFFECISDQRRRRNCRCIRAVRSGCRHRGS